MVSVLLVESLRSVEILAIEEKVERPEVPCGRMEELRDGGTTKDPR